MNQTQQDIFKYMQSICQDCTAKRVLYRPGPDCRLMVLAARQRKLKNKHPTR